MLRTLTGAFPEDDLRYDPSCSLSVEEGIRFGLAIEDLNNDYYEDPTWNVKGMRRVWEKVRVPLSTDTVVVDFEQLAANVQDLTVDVVLARYHFWGGIRPLVKAAGVCEMLQLSVAVHSSGELGIQLATMLHLGAVVPNLIFSADAHYHHLETNIQGGKFECRQGRIKVPDISGLGPRLRREKLERYAELYDELGGYPYDRDPGHPERYVLVPKQRWTAPT